MMALFEREKIRHPLIDFSHEALRMIINLRNSLTENKVLLEDLEKLVFDNILDRRLLLTQKFILLEKFYEVFNQCKDKQIDEADVKELDINNVIVNVNHFLWCLKFTANFDGENITKDKLLITKKYLDQNFFEELDQKDKDITEVNVKTTEEEIQNKEEVVVMCSHCLENLLEK